MLSQRGYDACHDLHRNINDGLRNFRIEDYNLIKTALEQNKPI